jgi:polysaccharide pyruvyl transferase WcaK-like protein
VRRRIALLSPPIGNGNLGDEAIVVATLQGLRDRCPDCDLYVVCPNPEDTQTRHGVAARPIAPASGPRPSPTPASAPGPSASGRPQPGIRAVVRRWPALVRTLKFLARPWEVARRLAHDLVFFAAAVRELRETRVLILTGSGVLSDHFGGPKNFPLTILRWTLAARLAGARVVFLSVGAGPLTAPLSRALVRGALKLVSYCSVRDVTSRTLLQPLMPRRPLLVVPDLAHGLNLSTVPQPPARPRPLVAINAFPHYDPRYWPVADAGRYQHYVSRLARFVSWLLENKYRILLVPTQLRADTRVLADLLDVLQASGGACRHAILTPRITGLDDLVSSLAEADLVVATRFHALLLALRLGRPAIALSNHHKMTDLMTAMGQADYVLDIDQFTPDVLRERFQRLESQAPAIQAELVQRAAALRAAVDHQFETVLALLDGRAASRDPQS